MITLTTPHDVNSVLGGNAPIPYNKLVVGPFSIDTVNVTINGQVRLSSTSNPQMPVIIGTLNINQVTAILEISVERLDFYRRVQLTGPQNTSVLALIRGSQDDLEGGLISLGVVAGVQSTGA